MGNYIGSKLFYLNLRSQPRITISTSAKFHWLTDSHMLLYAHWDEDPDEMAPLIMVSTVWALTREKVFGVSDKTIHKPVCSATEQS